MTKTSTLSNFDGPYQAAVKFAPRRPRQPVEVVAPKVFGRIGLKRTFWRDLTLARVLKGGRPSDGGRLGRYALIVAAGLGIAWGPALTYIKYGKVTYTSNFSLILPGAGASTSVSLSEIGQATSSSASAFSGSKISPTVTYKNLLMSANVIHAAAEKLKVDKKGFAAPTVKLVDETSFIFVEVVGDSAEDARDRANAIQDAFFDELTKLRNDETRRRDDSTVETVKKYQQMVNVVRTKIMTLQTKSGLTSTDQFSTYVTAADNLELRIAEGEAELAKLLRSKSSLATNLGINDKVAATTMKLHADPEFAVLSDATSKAEAEHASTSQQFGAKHPKVVDARARLIGARSQMMARASKITGIPIKKLVGKIDFAPTGERAALLTQLVNLSTSEQGLQAQLQVMKAELAENRVKLSSLISVSAELDRLQVEFKVAEAVFTSALARINTSKTDIFASYPMAQVSEAAVMPMQPSTPNKKIAIGSAVGSTLLLMLGLLLAWIRRPLIDKLLHMAHKPHDESKPA